MCVLSLNRGWMCIAVSGYNNNNIYRDIKTIGRILRCRREQQDWESLTPKVSCDSVIHYQLIYTLLKSRTGSFTSSHIFPGFVYFVVNKLTRSLATGKDTIRRRRDRDETCSILDTRSWFTQQSLAAARD